MRTIDDHATSLFGRHRDSLEISGDIMAPIDEAWDAERWLSSAPRLGGILIVEDFTKGETMATINFSVPDEVKREFQETFAHENKSAVITLLMKQAVEERKRQRTRAAAIEALLKLRQRQRPASDEEIRRARQLGRP